MHIKMLTRHLLYSTETRITLTPIEPNYRLYHEIIKCEIDQIYMFG